MLLSACMIVKDEEKMLKKTLPSLAKLVDEIILVDTGSKDKTIEIAKEFGAKVHNFPWVNDFSAARNESLKHASGDWIIWIDADEAVKPEEFVKFKDFLKEAKNDVYSAKIIECNPDQFDGSSFYFRVKVLRNNKGIRFDRPFNEQLVASNGEVLIGDIISSLNIYHWGNYQTVQLMNKKRDRNIKILINLLTDNADDKNYHYLLGNNYKQAGEYDKAIVEFKKAIELDKEKQFTSSVLVSLAWCYYNSKLVKEAYSTAVLALKEDPSEVSAYNILGALMIAASHPEKAIPLLEKAERIQPKEGFDKVNDIVSTKYFANLLMGDAYSKLGKKEEAIKYYEKAYGLEQNEVVRSKFEAIKCQ